MAGGRETDRAGRHCPRRARFGRAGVLDVGAQLHRSANRGKLCWQVKCREPAPADAREAVHNDAGDGGHLTVAGQLLGLSVPSLTDGEERPSARQPSAMAALPARAHLLTLPVPPCNLSEAGGRRFWAIPRPVGSPKMHRHYPTNSPEYKDSGSLRHGRPSAARRPGRPSRPVRRHPQVA